MLLGIDHLVIAVRDPDAAASELAATLGLAWTGGGRHEQVGTFNRLAFVGDSYLELIGVFDRDLVAANPEFRVGAAAAALLDHGHEGVATWAIASDDVAGDVRRLRAAGSTIGLPVPGSRTRPDGEIVRWMMAFPELGPESPPFLIEHEPTGAEWGPEARATRAADRHPVGGAVRLGALELPAGNLEVAVARHAATVGLAFDRSASIIVGTQTIRLRAADGEPAVVELSAEPGTPVLDVVRFGVRWRRRVRGTAGA